MPSRLPLRRLKRTSLLYDLKYKWVLNITLWLVDPSQEMTEYKIVKISFTNEKDLCKVHK